MTPIRSSKRLRNINKKKKLPYPKIHKVVESAIKPEVPLHIGIALKSPFRSEWIEATFGGYDKMHRSSTFSRPFLRSSLPPNSLILSPRLSFEVRNTDLDYFYNLRVRVCANGSKMIEGVHFDDSFSPAASGSSFCQGVSIATFLSMVFYFIDVDNAFQPMLSKILLSVTIFIYLHFI